MSDCTRTSDKPGICFVSLDNFAALVDDPKYGHIGGAEMQQVLIGRNLAKRGYRVTFITLDHGQDDEMEIDGMRIIKAYNPNVGIRVLRFLHPRLTILWRAMRRADADIYYQRTHDSVTGIVAAFCRQYRKKFVFAVAHDYDCLIDPPDSPAKHARILYRYGLRRAALIIAQTLTQQRLLRESFGIDSAVIPNCAPDYGRCLGGNDAVVSTRARRLLWIGGFTPVKRLELLLDVAEQIQDVQFDVVGNGDIRSEYVQGLRSRAQTVPNVHLHGKVPHADVHQFYQRAAALICTSHAEGFPNIFLEAWSHGVPVVSTFDPDNLISSNGIGIIVQDMRGFVSGIRTVLSDPRRWLEASRAARQYYLQNHTVDAVMPKFESVFREVMNKTPIVGLSK